MSRQFDITFTVEMGDKAYKRLCRSEDRAADNDENFPLWDMGLHMIDGLKLCGVKAKLIHWWLRRNADDLARQK